MTQSVGLARLDGELVGGGPDYAVRFVGGGVEFLPAIPTADKLHPLSLAVVGYGRGEAILPTAEEGLTHSGVTGRYDHGAFVETLEMRADGMKQNFVFEQLPQGQGDLVVRLRVASDLRPVEDGADAGMQFLTANGDGGVRIGSVLGVDADGARCAGSMSYEEGQLEFRLPAGFVETAALPLVLDPLVGTTFTVAGIFDDTDLDVAYDADENIYVAVWRRRFSLAAYGARGQRINDAGGLISNYFPIATPGPFLAPRIANIATEDAFMVVYAVGGDIFGRTIRATSASVEVSAEGIVRDTGDNLLTPDVGGEATFDNEGIVVWRNATTNRIEARQVNVDGDVSPPTISIGSNIVTVGGASTAWTNSTPRISSSGGSTGIHCIVWSRQLTSSPQTLVRAALVDRNVVVLENLMAITDTSTGDCDFPTVAGNGLNWVIAWEREAAPVSGDNDIQARAVGYNGNASAPNQGYFASGVVNIESQLNDDERAPDVSWMGDSALICYEDESFTAGDYDVFAQPIDLLSALSCAPRLTVDQAGGDQGPVRAVAKAAGGSSDDGALIVWSEFDASVGESRGYAVRYRADDGVSVNLGGGCGSAGTNSADCAIAGNFRFTARLRTSIPGRTAWWILAPTRLDVSCGTCTLVPDPWNGWVIPRTTDVAGNASIALGLPANTALVGVEFLHQWIISDPSNASCNLFDADLSDALRTTIQ
ncbi:MAG: hypothetical protein AB8H80_10770 [Planctomycetota bacterium]